MKKQFLLFCLCLFLIPLRIFAAPELVEDKTQILKGVVTEIVSEKKSQIPGTEVEALQQVVKAKIQSENGKIVEFSNDYIELKEGQTIFVSRVTDGLDGSVKYFFYDTYRIPVLIWLLMIFIVLTIIIGGKQGVRGLLSLFGSLVLILFAFIPAVLHGYSPIISSLVISSLIIVLGSFVTHGFNKTTSSAVIGMIITVALTGFLAEKTVQMAKLTGYESEEAVYLNMNFAGSIDIQGILLGGILIGLLGVLYDVAIGQAISVEELLRIAPHAPRRKIYLRAIRIGREHIGALVNTLAIAYVGASLPLLLLFSSFPGGKIGLINREIFAAEIVRTLIGSIGLILAVPICTWISVFMITKNQKGVSSFSSEDEEKLETSHSHSHHH